MYRLDVNHDEHRERGSQSEYARVSEKSDAPSGTRRYERPAESKPSVAIQTRGSSKIRNVALTAKKIETRLTIEEFVNQRPVVPGIPGL